MIIYRTENNEEKLTFHILNGLRFFFFGVPQGSTLSPFLLNIFLIDFLFTMSDIDIAIYVDDNIPYGSVKNIDEVKHSLQQTAITLNCFIDDLFQGNVDNFHLRVSSTTPFI